MTTTMTIAPAVVGVADAVLAVAIVILVVFYINSKRRERQSDDKWKTANDRLALILETSKVRLWTFDVPTQQFTWISQNGQPQKVYSYIDFGRRYSREDFDRLREALRMLTDGEKIRMTLEIGIKGADDDDGTKERDAVTTLSVLNRDADGHPLTILGTRSDITEDHLRRQRVNDTLMRYQAVFNTAMVGLAYYDAKGYLLQINQKGCETFDLDLDQLVRSHTTIFQLTGLTPKEFPLDRPEPMYVTQLFNHDPAHRFEWPEKRSDTIFYEVHILPVTDSRQRLLGIYVTGRDVTEMAMTYHKRREAMQQLEKANRELTEYVENINYSLKAGGMRMTHYSPDTHLLTIYSSIGHIERKLTQMKTLELVDEESRTTAMSIFNSMDSYTPARVNGNVKTTLGHEDGTPQYMQIDFIANTDAEGRVTDYFGMCRDISRLKATEQQLEVETAKAQEVENIKNSFLRNMSYEIRTPLNAVVGFAELFDMHHTPEEERIFIGEIKNNSAKLLKLINSILFLSRLDAHMIDITLQPTDFAACFESYCQQGWNNCRRKGVDYIVENPYEHLVLDIDISHFGLIIEQVAANAAEHTSRGSVLARCDYVNDSLLITVTDTGSGIDEKTMEHLFERFVAGSQDSSGLGLAISSELIQQMGGRIDVKSFVGKGTTVWITLPCTTTEILRKLSLQSHDTL